MARVIVEVATMMLMMITTIAMLASPSTSSSSSSSSSPPPALPPIKSYTPFPLKKPSPALKKKATTLTLEKMSTCPASLASLSPSPASCPVTKPTTVFVSSPPRRTPLANTTVPKKSALLASQPSRSISSPVKNSYLICGWSNDSPVVIQALNSLYDIDSTYEINFRASMEEMKNVREYIETNESFKHNVIVREPYQIMRGDVAATLHVAYLLLKNQFSQEPRRFLFFMSLMSSGELRAFRKAIMLLYHEEDKYLFYLGKTATASDKDDLEDFVQTHMKFTGRDNMLILQDVDLHPNSLR